MSIGLRRLVGALILILSVGLSGYLALSSALDRADNPPVSGSSRETLDA